MLVNLPTTEDLAAHTALLLEVREELRLVRQLLARPPDEFLTLDEVAAKVKKSRKTVLSWIQEGKYDAGGRLIKLQTVEGTPGYRLVPVAALHAFLQNLDFDLAQLPLATNPVPPRPVLDSRKALRKAS